MLVALLPTLAFADPLGGGGVAASIAVDVLGPLPADTTLDRVETHAEYLRYHLRTDRAFVVELTPQRGGSAICAGGGADLWVRMDLSDAAESFVWDPLPAIVTQMCERLPAHPPVFAPPVAATAPKKAPEATDAPWDPLPAWRWRPLHAVLVPFLALAIWLIPRDRAALGVGLLALLVRIGLSPPTVLLGGDAAYERLLRARGLWDPDPYYGETWPALMGLAWRAAGSPDHFVHAANIGFSALTVVYTVALARRVGASGIGATAAGLLLAVHPLAVAVAGMEDLFVLVGLLQVVAVMAAVGPDVRRRNDASARRARPLEAWAAALAVGLLVHLRPEQAAFSLVPLAILAWRRAWSPLAVALALCFWRWAEIVGADGAIGRGAGILGWSRWTDPDFLGSFLHVGPHHPALLLDFTRSPFAFALLAGIGALGVRRPEGHRLLVPLAALLLPLAVVLPKTSPLADPVRFQLPGFAFAAVLAGIALAPLVEARPLGARPQAWRRAALLAWGGGLLLTGIVARRPLDGGWAWAHEHLFLRAHLGDMPADTLVFYRPDQDPHHQFGAWVDAVSPGRWRPLGGGPIEPGAWYWRGFPDGAAGVWPPAPCVFEPILVTTVTSLTDGWIVLPPGPLEVGFYRIGACG
ncbi:MAG: hypothetical protein Q8P18_16400 [Pseudomonadota bacterium]|nr:hypothetical protein [Pseudomonadota bacterium]